MDSDIQRRLAAAAKHLAPSDGRVSKKPVPPTRKPAQKKRLIAVASALVVLGILMVGGYLTLGHHTGKGAEAAKVVPAEIQKSVSFPVPYPLPASLPSGYHLDQNSFSSKNQVVLYSVSYGQDKKIAFTVQQKPSDEDLHTFYTNQLPLRLELATNVGTAQIGILNNQTFASLPTKSNSWLLVTAPKDISPEEFNQTLKALQQ